MTAAPGTGQHAPGPPPGRRSPARPRRRGAGRRPGRRSVVSSVVGQHPVAARPGRRARSAPVDVLPGQGHEELARRPGVRESRPAPAKAAGRAARRRLDRSPAVRPRPPGPCQQARRLPGRPPPRRRGSAAQLIARSFRDPVPDDLAVVQVAAPGRRPAGSPRAPCRRRPRCRPARRRPGPRRWPARPVDARPRQPSDRGAVDRVVARPRLPRQMAAGSSLRGLSEVIQTRSAPRAATSPIRGRLPRSRSPPQPKTTSSRPSASSSQVASTAARASWVWA